MSTFKYIKLTNPLNNNMNNIIGLFIKAIGVISGQKIDEYLGIKPDEKIVPLVFCDSYERLLQDGVTCPREFVIERSDFYYQEVGGKPISGFTMLKSRLQYLEKHDTEVSVNVISLRDWFAGLFRRYCCQDEHVHGSSNLLELSHDNCVTTCKKWFGEVFTADTTEAEKKSIGVFWDRFETLPSVMTVVPDYLGAYKNLLKRLFYDEFEMVKSSIIDYRNYMKAEGGRYENSTVVGEKIIFRNNCFCFVHRIERALPRTKGLELKFNAPTLKFNILVLDDNPNAAQNKLGKDPGLSDVFDFDCRELKARITGGEFAINTINNLKMIRECPHPRSYDFALLDLSLGESAGGDLMGYHAISFLHQVFPQMPIMVYSRFSDMGHIARAFRCGAKWFLKKGEESKLPRHAHSVMRRIEWQKEWQLISSGLWEWKSEKLETCRQRAFDERFKASREWQYLTYKCLEKYPGKLVVVCPLGGGLSTAVTFRAVKGTIRDEHPLQMPVIVKIDNVFNTRLEYERYFRFVRPYIANQSGRIEEPERVLDDDNAAIVYTFAGRQHARYELMSMKDMIGRDVKNRSSCLFEAYEKAFDILFDEILSRIHAVKPCLEFDAINLQGERLSDFPNRSFSEVNVDGPSIAPNDFLANWLCRMPMGRELRDLQFISQCRASDDTPCYEFHRKGTVNGRCVIEALDFTDKCTIVMTGANIDHVVKYRPHTYPCMTLWVDKCANPNIVLEEAIPEFVKKAVEKLHGSKEIEQYRASNEFAEILKRLMNEPLSAGRPSDDFYNIKDSKDKVIDSKFWEGAFLEIDNKEKTAFNALPSLFRVAKELLNGMLAKKIMGCPAGIVHGDLNYDNIMLETKKRLSSDSAFTTDIPDVKDVWIIDFARTRRDLIAHDFNVLFTSTLGLLFDLDVWKSKETIAHDIYYRSMRQFWGERAKVNDTILYNRFIETIFRPFVVKAVFDKLDAVPDGMEHDNRLVLIFKILRRIRAAALKAGMTEESYAFTTALACMVASRVYIVHEANAPAAAAMIATAFICLAKLRRMEAEAGR